MRIHGTIPAFLAFILPWITSTAGVSVTLPLRWLDKQAYVANVTLNGAPALFQVGTFNQETWVACGRFGDRDCTSSGDAGGGKMAIENGYFGFDFLNGQKLALEDKVSGATIQYSSLSGMLRAMYDATVAASLPLFGSDTVGVLSLGSSSSIVCGSALPADGAFACSNFSVYLSSKSSGAGSFVILNGANDASVLLSVSRATTRYVMPVRATDEKGWRNKRWYLSLFGARFGDNKSSDPVVFSYLKGPGGDAKALVSLNHATLQMPPTEHTRFKTTYLSVCAESKSNVMGSYYICDASVMNNLPWISLHIGDKVLYLDPVDYTYVSSTDATKRVVLVASSAKDDTWVLGAPFFRKFPLTFSPTADTIEVFCTTDASCTGLQSGSTTRVPVTTYPAEETVEDPATQAPVKPRDGSNGGSKKDGSNDDSSASSGGIFVPLKGALPGNHSQRGFTAWDQWIAKIASCVVVLALVI